MTRLFGELRGRMTARGLDQPTLAYAIKRSTSYVSLRFRGLAHWGQDDQYAIMDELRIPYSEMHIYFPKNGKDISQPIHTGLR